MRWLPQWNSMNSIVWHNVWCSNSKLARRQWVHYQTLRFFTPDFIRFGLL
uniref:Uncharacterized protein n=1 Tax=Setaria italica TaxID=4555 RepID=K3Y2B5_SETIT